MFARATFPLTLAQAAQITCRRAVPRAPARVRRRLRRRRQRPRPVAAGAAGPRSGDAVEVLTGLPGRAGRRSTRRPPRAMTMARHLQAPLGLSGPHRRATSSRRRSRRCWRWSRCCWAVRGAGHAARGRAADQRDDGERADPVPGRLGARRRAAGHGSRRAGARADRRLEHVMSVSRPGPGRDHRAVQGRRAAHRGAGAPVRHAHFATRTGCRAASACCSRSSSPRASTTCRSSRSTLFSEDPASAPRPRARRARARGRAEARARHARSRDARRPGPRRHVGSTRRA